MLRYIRKNKNLGLESYAKKEDAPLYGLLIHAIINTEKQFMVFYYSIWKDCPYTGRSIGAYVVFYQGGPIDNCTHVSGPVAQHSAESEYNVSCTAVMCLS